MSDEKLSLADVLYKNRKLVLAILGVPVLGIVIAAGLIYYLKPDNMVVALGVILFVGIQYIMIMFFWMKRVEKMAKNPSDETVEQIVKIPVAPITVDPETVLAPEEKRVLPVEKE